MTPSSPREADLVVVLEAEFGKKERELETVSLPPPPTVKIYSKFLAKWFNLMNCFNKISSLSM